VKQLVDRPNFAHLATIMPDGSPHSAPVWIGRERGLLLIYTAASSLKGKKRWATPGCQFSMVDFDDPYLEVQMRGRVVERYSDPELRHFDAMSLKYVGKSWPYRDEESLIALIIGLAKVRYSKQPFEHRPARKA